MKANPGGILAPEDVIGRDKLIAKIWAILEQQSVILSAERRMGKTNMIKKMQAEGKDNKLIIFRDLEGMRSPIEFVEAVWEDVEKYLSKSQKTTQKVRQFISQFQDAEFSGFKFPKIAATHWKILLTKTIEDLVTNQEHQVIFLWDEVPYMLGNIGDEESMEMLDILRSLRQNYPQVRMVFTGSIGLHHVIKKLKEAGYKNDPTNDMYPIDVPPLSLSNASELTTRLIEGEKIETDNIEIMAQYISEEVSGIPFYIHILISKLKFIYGFIDKKTVEKTINKSLINPLNIWKIEHYRDRIDNYYTEYEKKYALKILDILAIESGLSFQDLWNRLALDDEEIFRSVLKLLLKDYYLIKENTIFKFKINIVKKYWVISRTL
ncbi:hypothetical protein [Crocosphaera sp.]|uniref:hypothetical protein n=1 Tax=Crocosphaera sp. TaxID=2729996 RepID=UPI00262D66AA|nr:hypothetical protein [Crocosphaera sp.]MDJ0580477.1 hypothetical protein [Crocosphaera sp.]